MIRKIAVLLRVEDLEQRRRWVAAPIGSHLVDLVEHEDRVSRAGNFHLLENPARHGADVGPAMTADLGLVVDAAKREPDELAPQRSRNRLAEAGLANAGRPHEAENRRAEALRALADGHVLQDPFFDFLDTIVVFVEHGSSGLDVP